jgi:hypothetical protein
MFQTVATSGRADGCATRRGRSRCDSRVILTQHAASRRRVVRNRQEVAVPIVQIDDVICLRFVYVRPVKS